MTVASDEIQDVNVDGELSLQTPLTFGILPRALTVVVPA
jgi:diacylglycerol kinase family enzyme